MLYREKFGEQIRALPENPGIYQFTDQNGNILYIGKAKSIKKRVSSYFNKNQSGKTLVMLKKASEIKHIVVENESDALLLENTLIKQYQPRYNILLKDDKTFPWICIKNEPFPRVFSTRNIVKDGSRYFGPYTSGLMVKTLIALIRQLYNLRTCSLNLSEENIKAGKFKVCLEYHIGNCKGPCIGLQPVSEYENSIHEIFEILKGNITSVISHLRNIMLNLSSELKFEEAQKVKEKIELLSRYRAKSTVVSNKIRNVDVFTLTGEGDVSWVNYIKIIEGSVIQSFTLELKCRIDEEKDSLLATAIAEIRQRYESDAHEVIVPFKPDIFLDNVKYTIPSRGEKKKLLELSLRNASQYRLEQKKRQADRDFKSGTNAVLERLKKDLRMNVTPFHIECFDNSNIMGTNPVAACVVFRNARPARSEYRHFNIRSVSGPNDFASMEEIVLRRYTRTLNEEKQLPQLIIVDGGKGQLSSAVKSLKKLRISDKVTIIGIAKKLEEIYFPGDSLPLWLDKNSPSLRLIQQLRDEAHRFGINFHRTKRNKNMTKSVLDEIDGIGDKTKEKLLKAYNSVETLKKISPDELRKIVGASKAEKIREFFKNRPGS